MHLKGVTAWFSDGEEERQKILEMGEPWSGLQILEIGCGEGELCRRMAKKGGGVTGIDYSEEALHRAFLNEDICNYACCDYRGINKKRRWNRIVMQGVLEHLDDPLTELKWMIDNLLVKDGDIITSSPCFLNTRGIVWMALNMVGAVMSKTDLHYLNPWEFEDFCDRYGYQLKMEHCDWSWGNDMKCWQDLKQRIPLALKDGNLPVDQKKIDDFIDWLFIAGLHSETGATMVYRIMT